MAAGCSGKEGTESSLVASNEGTLRHIEAGQKVKTPRTAQVVAFHDGRTLTGTATLTPVTGARRDTLKVSAVVQPLRDYGAMFELRSSAGPVQVFNI